MNDQTRHGQDIEWRVIPFAPLYEVSDDGQVRRAAGGVSTFPGRLLKAWQEDNGYWRVTLRIDGRSEKHWVQRIVLFAFRGPPPTPEHESAHGDGDRSNNRLGNLRWATPVENSEDSAKHGTRCLGEDHGQAKLTNADVAAIRARSTGAWGEQTALAREFSVHQPQIYRIINRQSRAQETSR